MLALTENERKAGVHRKSIEYMTMSEALYKDAKDVALKIFFWNLKIDMRITFLLHTSKKSLKIYQQSTSMLICK